ncbi:glucosamine-6-phosphate deaminase [Arcticibacterium luteifluviistationis]|uniref:Glucosamine-6-phosphate deaminase n=1 Tax=Arcticibacterium luteifluviistationis TaxID=1784714 RepID=A0A2Z4GF85_9BACT|nr:glucosamine-6-phosphate deaminase [Arcticibacterium luteifluviistationis]AWV99705.1 glucosamine-6-phosphate deaminase [Arcticibacterium luteifluviistationis]
MQETQIIREPIAYEKVPTRIFPNSEEASKAVANEIAELIKTKQKAGQQAVLGLATGSSPKTVYAELIRMHKEEGLSFKNVISFNLDEYYPMQPDAIQSYWRFMKEQLFDHVDIEPGNFHIPDGTVSPSMLAQHCQDYEKKIKDAGGLDFQLLGIGGNGHIGFNEPGSLENTKTRLMMLDQSTRAAAKTDFGGELTKVPKKAITLGVAKILQAKRIVLLAWGERKAPMICNAVEGTVSAQNPSSYLQKHPNALFVIDEAAGSGLKRMKTPWLVEDVKWTNSMTKKAVTGLSIGLGKSVLKLTNEDYNDNGLSDLLASSGNAYDINIDIFNQLQRTITGWPGGKPDADDTHRPERALPKKKKCLIFSPHPDDDIISMGGTFQRLVDQGQDVHVAYQTSGNIAVSDEEAHRFLEFVIDYNKGFNVENKETLETYKDAIDYLNNKKDSELDSPTVRLVKGIIRKGEAKATCRLVGIPAENVHFLDMPFYETGRVQKNPLGKEDVKIVSALIEELKPQQIYAAGDLADPHGTHKVCLDAIFESLKELRHKNYMKDCWVWLYRGAWAEWDIHEIEMAVPMSPNQVMQKRMGIFKHQSQKDGVVFQGADSREFWQRAEERNQGTAKLYNDLGLAEYEAMEAFVRYHF